MVSRTVPPHAWIPICHSYVTLLFVTGGGVSSIPDVRDGSLVSFEKEAAKNEQQNSETKVKHPVRSPHSERRGGKYVVRAAVMLGWAALVSCVNSDVSSARKSWHQHVTAESAVLQLSDSLSSVDL